jgi:hypothetical protein
VSLVRVLVVDDFEPIRQFACTELGKRSDLQVVQVDREADRLLPIVKRSHRTVRADQRKVLIINVPRPGRGRRVGVEGPMIDGLPGGLEQSGLRGRRMHPAQDYPTTIQRLSSICSLMCSGMQRTSVGSIPVRLRRASSAVLLLCGHLILVLQFPM